MAKITAVDENMKVEDATVEETVTPVEDVVVEPEETIDSDFSVDNTEESYDEDAMPLPSGEEDATPVYNGDVAQQSSETIGKKWNEYTTGTDLDDTDELMILDTSAKANKRTLLSKLSDYVLGKLADKVFAKLETQNQTVIGALNELNSKRDKRICRVVTNSNSEVHTVKTDSLYESFLIYGQRAGIDIFEIINTHNNDNYTMLRLGGAIIDYEKSNNGALILKIPEYASICIIAGNDLSSSLN